MIMSLKQKKINYKPRIKLNHNIIYNTLSSGGSRPSDKGRGGGGHPDPEIRGGGAWSPKNIFLALQASVWSGWGPSPRFTTA